jgi:NAD(P)-dependent dehydrogenase (short-subunit alcohol dehydrogenase family)
MNNKVVFITGAGSGMGQLAAKRALAEGSAVAALDVNTSGLELLGSAKNLLKLVVDITDPVAVKAAVEQTEKELGPIDRVINAAAIMPLGLLMEQYLNIMHRIMAINYGGLINVAKAALPGMLGRSRGEFISFASAVGYVPAIYFGAYTASKFAVVAFTEVLRNENRKSGVRFACVAPPGVATPLLNLPEGTVRPKSLDQTPPLSPDEVLDAIESGIARGKFLIMPGLGTKISYLLRRLSPDLAWWLVRKIEGL